MTKCKYCGKEITMTLGGWYHLDSMRWYCHPSYIATPEEGK